MTVIALLLSLSVPAWSQSTGTLTFAEVAAAVEAANPGLAAARGRAAAAGARVVQSWTPDRPTLELERMYAPSGRDPLSGADEKSWSVRQSLPLPPVLWYRRGAAARMAEAEARRADAVRTALLARARRAFAMLGLAWSEEELLGENMELMRRVARAAEAKLSAGRAGQTDALKAQVELSRLTGLREASRRERAALAAELAALMGRDAGAAMERPADDALPAGLEPAQAARAALEARPELAAAEAEAEGARAAAALARAELLPELMLQYRRRSAAMTGRTHDAVVGFSLPLWAWKPAAAVREADAARAAAASERDAARLEAAAAARAAAERFSGAARLAEVYRTTVLPQAEAALRTAEAAYQSDRGSFLDLLDAQRSLLDLALEYRRAAADAAGRRAELEQAVGRGI